MKKMILMLISMVAVVQIANAEAKITFLEHFNKDATGKSLLPLEFPKNEKGKVKGQVDFVETRFGNGALCATEKDQIVYNANRIVTPSKGSIELWLTVNKDLNTAKQNIYLLKVVFDENNSMGLYYNVKTQKITFWMRDADTPATKYRYHSPKYPLILPTSTKISWEKGETHRIALTWSKSVQLIYIDGKKNIGAYFTSITAKPDNNSKLILIGDKRKYFTFDELRIWDNMIVPKKTNSKPTLEK